jgi:hypothetical protein
MKHKTDAIENGNNIINELKENGVPDDAARCAAISTVNIVLSRIRYGTTTHSLFMRTLNYLIESNEKSKN